MKRKYRLKVIAGLLLCGGTLSQAGGCLTGLVNGSLATLDFCALLGPDCVLGPIAPCGDPNDAGDDLLLDCPPPPPPG